MIRKISKPIFLALLFFSSAAQAQEYLGNFEMEASFYGGNWAHTAGSLQAGEGYMGSSRQFMGGSYIGLNFSYYTEQVWWIKFIKGSLILPVNYKAKGWTARDWWSDLPDVDTYTKGTRAYDFNAEWPSIELVFSLFDEMWETTLTTKGWWKNQVRLAPVAFSRATGFVPYFLMDFVFLPNDYLSSAESSYLNYRNAFNKSIPDPITGSWDALKMAVRLEYGAFVPNPIDPQLFYILLRLDVFAKDIYFLDDPVGLSFRTEMEFQVPKTTLRINFFQELTMSYFNRPEAWKSNRVYKSDALWWTVGIELKYRIDWYRGK